MSDKPPLPEGFRYGAHSGMLTIEGSQGSVSIDLKQRKYALGLTAYMTQSPKCSGRGWQNRLIRHALRALQNVHGFIRP